jgi:hypothetical protein
MGDSSPTDAGPDKAGAGEPPIGILLCGDSAYFRLVLDNLRNTLALCRDAEILVYDWGFKPAQRAQLQGLSDRIEVVDWTAEIAALSPISVDPSLERDFALRFNARAPYLKRKIGKKIIKSRPNARYSRAALRGALLFEAKVRQKVACMIDASRRFGRRRFVFLDADAFLTGPLDQGDDDVFSADIAFTVIDRPDWVFEENRCYVINLGVVLFGSRVAARDRFLARWMSQCNETDEYCSEQTAAVRLLQAKAPGIFESGSATVGLSDGDVTIRFLPSREYNFEWIDELDENADLRPIRVLHFKDRYQHLNTKRLIDRAIAARKAP